MAALCYGPGVMFHPKWLHQQVGRGPPILLSTSERTCIRSIIACGHISDQSPIQEYYNLNYVWELMKKGFRCNSNNNGVRDCVRLRAGRP